MFFNKNKITKILSALLVSSQLFLSCTNSNERKHQIQQYLDFNYPNLKLSVVSVRSMANEANLDFSKYAFLAIDQSDNEIWGSWNSKESTTNDIQAVYNTLLEEKQWEGDLREKLPASIKGDIYCKKVKKQSINDKDYIQIDLFCFNEINNQNKDSLLNSIKSGIRKYIQDNSNALYSAQIQFTFDGEGRKQIPYDERKISASNWEYYDGYLETRISNRPDRETETPLSLSGSSFLIETFREEAWKQLVSEIKPESPHYVIYSNSRFFLIDRSDLENVFFLFEQKNKAKNNQFVRFYSGYYNLKTKQNHSIKPIEFTGDARLNKNIEFLIPEDCR